MEGSDWLVSGGGHWRGSGRDGGGFRWAQWRGSGGPEWGLLGL